MITKLLFIIPISYLLSSNILLLGILTTIKQGYIKGEEVFDEEWEKYKNLFKRKPFIAITLISATYPLVIFKKMYETRNDMYLLLKQLIKPRKK